MKTIAQQIKWDFEANGSLKITAKNGFTIYFENSNGYWETREYDSDGYQISYEDSKGYWVKTKYDEKGIRIYFEDSDGRIEDDIPKLCENKIVEIDGIKYKLVKA